MTTAARVYRQTVLLILVVAVVLVAAVFTIGSAASARAAVEHSDTTRYTYDAPGGLAKVRIVGAGGAVAGVVRIDRSAFPHPGEAQLVYDPSRNLVAPNPARFCSFSGKTEVLMADGSTEPISEVEVGDHVLAEDPETGERGARQITHLWTHQDTIVDLEIDGHDVATTEDHPFWNATDSEWQRADALDTGDLVLTADGATLAIDGIDWGSERTTTAYNLTVDEIHTYYVAVAGEEVLVHNTCPWELDALSASGHRVISNDGLNRAAQKLQQHGGQGNLPVISGSVGQRNALATNLLDDILTAPGTRVATNQGGNFAGGRTFIDPLGRGAVYDIDGVFQYFGTFR